MKKIYFALAFAAVMSFAVACEKDPAGEGGQTDNPIKDATTFTIVNDSVDVSVDGGQVAVEYVFPNRPAAEDGKFTVNLEDYPWISNFTYTDSQLSFYVSENAGAIRDAALAVQYRYGGSNIIEDSLFIHQDGQPYDVYFEASLATGEYYEADVAVAGTNEHCLRLYKGEEDEKGEPLYSIRLFTPGDPLNVRDSTNGWDYIGTIYEGNYVVEEGSFGDHSLMTIDGTYSSYYVFMSLDPNGRQDQHFIKSGSLRITWLNEDGSQMLMEGSFVGDDGRDYGVKFEGPLTDFVWYGSGR
ncbi:MAG TPA: hypothetical protein IAC03_02600 [Candidatus Coprenecus pullistercoris]|nr:hypothetical protein [Candidatus Coprenecus pullistercoris]